ncbi:unnamed protein product [Gadus morhua 'NCC']
MELAQLRTHRRSNVLMCSTPADQLRPRLTSVLHVRRITSGQRRDKRLAAPGNHRVNGRDAAVPHGRGAARPRCRTAAPLIRSMAVLISRFLR